MSVLVEPMVWGTRFCHFIHYTVYTHYGDHPCKGFDSSYNHLKVGAVGSDYCRSPIMIKCDERKRVSINTPPHSNAYFLVLSRDWWTEFILIMGARLDWGLNPVEPSAVTGKLFPCLSIPSFIVNHISGLKTSLLVWISYWMSPRNMIYCSLN